MDSLLMLGSTNCGYAPAIGTRPEDFERSEWLMIPMNLLLPEGKG